MRLRSSAPRHSSSVLSARAPPPPPPTLLTRISIPPKAATAASTSRAAWSGCPTSARQDATATPSARKAASAAARGAAERADSTRQHPSAAKAVAVARPIPRLEPVIRATLSFSFRSIARLHSACPGRASIKGGLGKKPQDEHEHALASLIEPRNQPCCPGAVGAVLLAKLRAPQPLFGTDARQKWQDHECREQHAQPRPKGKIPPQNVDEQP